LILPVKAGEAVNNPSAEDPEESTPTESLPAESQPTGNAGQISSEVSASGEGSSFFPAWIAAIAAVILATVAGVILWKRKKKA
jgi:LPXTG-motif cell wall-anchored protein